MSVEFADLALQLFDSTNRFRQQIFYLALQGERSAFRHAQVDRESGLLR